MKRFFLPIMCLFMGAACGDIPQPITSQTLDSHPVDSQPVDSQPFGPQTFDGTDDSVRPYWIKIRSEGTEHKRIPVSADKLVKGEETCHLEGNALIYLSSSPLKLTNGHYLINRTEIPKGCKFSSGFVFVGHVTEVSATVVEETPKAGFSLQVKKHTWLKRGTNESDYLDLAEEKCTLHYDESIAIQGPPLVFDERHYVVNLANKIPGCKFSQGLVYKKHIELKIPFEKPLSSVLGRLYAQHSYDVAAVMPGTGRCYKGVADAMVRTLKSNPWATHGIPPRSAYQFGRWANANPEALANIFQLKRAYMSPWHAPIGSVLVFEPGYSGAHRIHGHIEIKVNESLVCSDYCSTIYRTPSYIYVPE